MENPLGAVSCHLTFASPEEAFVQAAGYGIEAIEWFESREPRFSLPDTAREIRELAAKYGIANTYHAPYLGPWSLGSLDASEAADRAVDMVERAARLEARSVTVHLGASRQGRDRGEALRVAGGAIAAAAATAEREGVVIALENFTRSHGELDLGDSVEEIESALAHCPSGIVGLTLDTGHAAITRCLPEILDRLGGRIVNTHLHDTDGTSDGHLRPGAGIIDWEWLLGRLLALDYHGPLTFEFREDTGVYPEFSTFVRSIGRARS